VARLFPAVAVAASYERGWLRGDLLAGLTLWALLIPQGLAYGQLAGLSPVTGLYIGLVGMLVYALLGSSRYMTVGPESSVAMIVAVELGPLAGGDRARYVALAGLLALLVGAFLVLGFVARLGILTRLLSAPVLTGYLAGSGIVIALSQLPKVTGISTDRSYPGVLPGLVRSADTVEPWAIAIALGTVVVTVGLARVSKLLPAALVALALATVFVAATGLSDTVAVVGHVQAGLPQIALPDAGFHDIGSLLAPAGSIALLVFASTVLTGEALAARDRERVRPGRELLALGAANFGAGLVHGFPANGSDSRSFAVAAAGARTQLAGVVGAGLLVATLLVLTPLFRNLPAAALGAVVIVTALRLVDGRELRRLWHVRSSDFVLAIVTLAGVLILGVLGGIAVGVVASLLEVLRRAAMPHTALLGRLGGGTPAYRDVEQHEDLETMPGLIVYRFDAPLFFANADLFRDQLLRLVHEAATPVRQVIVNAEAIYDIDTTGIRMLERLHDELAAESVRLGFARLKTRPRSLMRATGLEERIGIENFWLRVEDAASAFDAEQAGR
jgi:sulfate permease, SulP family